MQLRLPMDRKISISVNVEENSCLANTIASNKKHLIDELTVIGHYSSKLDGEFLRSMCNSLDADGHRTGGRLERLNLSQAQLRCCASPRCNTNQISSDEFKDCITLREIVLSELTSINAKAFSGCISLQSIGYKGFHCFQSLKGILYQVGKWECLPSDYRKFTFPQKHLVKYPSAKQDTKDIDFDNVTLIEDYAFEDFCGTDLYLPLVPPTLTSLAFNNVDVTKVRIHVPQGSFSSYWSHPVWQDFQIIEDNNV